MWVLKGVLLTGRGHAGDMCPVTWPHVDCRCYQSKAPRTQQNFFDDNADRVSTSSDSLCSCVKDVSQASSCFCFCTNCDTCRYQAVLLRLHSWLQCPETFEKIWYVCLLSSRVCRRSSLFFHDVMGSDSTCLRL